ncbi:MFS transporter [Rothia koreensis]|jgi:DHA1 family inner membrane transport protein|nr:MFS transporter [Rothia koreensis]
MNQASTTDASLNDAAIATRIWPLLGACALGLVPFTIYSNFLVDITRNSGHDATLMGSLRGVGGVAALLVGLTCAPLLDRVPRRSAVIWSLLLLAAACVVGLVGPVWAWALFCLLVGAATSVLNPAASAMAADRFDDESTSGRAATQVSAVMTLTAVLSAPLLAGPAVWWGWRGDLIATAVLCSALAMALFLARPASAEHSTADRNGPGTGYLRSFRIASTLASVPMLLAASALRTAAFMGQLAYLAVLYDERFHLGAGVFSLVWTLSGLSFFLGNWFGGFAIRRADNPVVTAIAGAVAAMVGAVAVLVLFLTDHLPAALLATAALGVSHAVLAAAMTTLLVRQSGGHRGTVLGLNGAGQSLGVCLGASVAGLGAMAWGWHGAGFVLAGLTAGACFASLAAARRLNVEYRRERS